MNTINCTVALLLSIYIVLINTSTAQDLNCLLSSDDDPVNDYDDTIIAEDHEYAQFSQRDRAIAVVKRIRRKSLPFYDEVIDNIIMSLCDVEKESERCVPEQSSFAAKNWEDSCIIAEGYLCPQGMCERTSNCYWNSVKSGENRTKRFPEEKYETALEELYGLKNSYIRDVAQTGIIGIAISAILLLTWCIYFIGRYCCCCLWTSSSICYLCSPIPREEGYKICRHWLFPILIYMISFAGIVGSGSIAFIGNEDINAATTWSFLHASNLVEDLQTFLSVSEEPLVNIENIVQVAADDAFDIFNGTGYITDTARSILSAFEDFESMHLDGLKKSSNIEGFGSATKAFDLEVTPIIDEMQGMLDTLEIDLYDNVDDIQAGLTAATTSIESLKNETVSWYQDILSYEKKEFDLRTNRNLSTLGIFLISIVTSFAGFCGILAMRLSRCSNIHRLISFSGFCSAVLGCISLTLAFMTLTASFIWSDACEIMTIITSDFEPLLGETIAHGANAIFNDTNLAVAFNLSSKIEFQSKFDEGFRIIEDVNISQQFEMVTTPLHDVHTSLGSISSTALDAFNDLLDTPLCPFSGDQYDESTIRQPWIANVKKGFTAWDSINGKKVNYSRQSGENAIQYITRIYDVPDPSCSSFTSLIHDGYQIYLDAFDTEQKMIADLGFDCPSELSDYSSLTCPTIEFRKEGYNQTIIKWVDDYEENITDTAKTLLSIATTSVGETMKNIQAFLCNMNVSFIASGYHALHGEVCESMLGGFAQINFALLALSFFLQLAAVLLNTLATRLQGRSAKQVIDEAYGSPRSSVMSGRPNLSKAHLYC